MFNQFSILSVNQHNQQALANCNFQNDLSSHLKQSLFVRQISSQNKAIRYSDHSFKNFNLDQNQFKNSNVLGSGKNESIPDIIAQNKLDQIQIQNYIDLNQTVGNHKDKFEQIYSQGMCKVPFEEENKNFIYKHQGIFKQIKDLERIKQNLDLSQHSNQIQGWNQKSSIGKLWDDFNFDFDQQQIDFQKQKLFKKSTQNYFEEEFDYQPLLRLKPKIMNQKKSLQVNQLADQIQKRFSQQLSQKILGSQFRKEKTNSQKSNERDFEIIDQEYSDSINEIKNLLPKNYSLIHASTVKSQKIGYYNGVIAIVFKNQLEFKDIDIQKITLKNGQECKIYDYPQIIKLCIDQDAIMHQIFQGFQIYQTLMSQQINEIWQSAYQPQKLFKNMQNKLVFNIQYLKSFIEEIGSSDSEDEKKHVMITDAVKAVYYALNLIFISHNQFTPPPTEITDLVQECKNFLSEFKFNLVEQIFSHKNSQINVDSEFFKFLDDSCNIKSMYYMKDEQDEKRNIHLIEEFRKLMKNAN